jgi:hypothetical protein
LIASVYIFSYGSVISKIDVTPAARSLLEISSAVPLILIISLCLVIGSLYTTFLEGIVDWLHRVIIKNGTKLERSKLKRIFIKSFSPYSDSAEKRLITEVLRFHREFYSGNMGETRTDLETAFVISVLTETLWMEGKLAGTALDNPYDRIRSEGEMRVASGLLLPLASTVIAYSLNANEYQIIASLLGGVLLAIPMVNYGLYYYRKANSFLAHHIADGKVLSPSMETLKRISGNHPSA